MRDIGSRIERYRLSRYSRPSEPLWRRYWWTAPLLGLWLLWIGVISDHSFYQIWRLGRENAAARSQVEQAHGQIESLDRALKDPAARRELTEHMLREKSGMARPDEIIYRIRGDESLGVH